MEIKSNSVIFCPITIINDDEIFGYRNGRLCVFNIKNNSVEYFCKIKNSFIGSICLRINILSRMKRLINASGIKCGNYVIFAFKGTIWKFDLINKSINNIFKLNHGSRPLKFISISDNPSFETGIYFGEYFGNPNMNEVKIYKLDIEKMNTEIVYTFIEGEINHIHSLIEDKANDCLWILSGDFDNAAGIWMAKDNFSKVTLIFGGHQDFRSCVACPIGKGLLYATDTPFSQNTVRLLHKKEGKWVNRKLFEINGSVIYGYNTEKYLFISTSVEPNGHSNNLLESFISMKKGDGIKDYISYIYKIDKETFGYKIIYEAKKDFLPFVLFQFGTLLFPSGSWDRNILPIFHIATKNNDLKTLFLEF